MINCARKVDELFSLLLPPGGRPESAYPNSVISSSDKTPEDHKVNRKWISRKQFVDGRTDVESKIVVSDIARLQGGSSGSNYQTMVLWIGMLAGKAMEALGRNPEAADLIRQNMILAIAFAEAIAIYALVVAVIILFV